MINKLFALGFSVCLSSQAFGTEITKDDFNSYKKDTGIKGVVTRSVESIMQLNKQESSTEPFGSEYKKINAQKDQIQHKIWDACLNSGYTESEMAEVGIVKCNAEKLLINLKIKDGWKTTEQTIELTKD